MPGLVVACYRQSAAWTCKEILLADNALTTRLAEFPNPLVALFLALDAHKDYAVSVGALQTMVDFRGQKLGGLNLRGRHFYLSRPFVEGHGTPEMMAAHGFVWRVHNADHQYWRRDGLAHHQDFKAAIEDMTGVPI